MDAQKAAVMVLELRRKHVMSYLAEVMSLYAEYPDDGVPAVHGLELYLGIEADDGGRSVESFWPFRGDFAVKRRNYAERQWCARQVLEIVSFYNPSDEEFQYVMWEAMDFCPSVTGEGVEPPPAPLPAYDSRNIFDEGDASAADMRGAEE